MTNFTQRILTGLLIILVMVTLTLLGIWTYLALVLLLNLLCLNEFYNLFRTQTPKKWQGLLLAFTLFSSIVLAVFSFLPWPVIFFSLPVVTGIFISELYRRSDTPFTRLSFTFLGLLYVSVPAIFLACLALLPFPYDSFHPHTVLGFFFIVWASDSGAYGAGKLFGKHPLFLRVSPKKTWEGSLGGALIAFITAMINSVYFQEIGRMDWIIITLIVIVAGTFGDLVKSMMKRSLHVKDSGNLLPGHGGFLDRFDSMFASAPFVFCYIFLVF